MCFVLSGAIFRHHVPLRQSAGTDTIQYVAGAWRVFWLVLSLLFEFGFFHYVMHEPWEKLLADYNIFRGRLLIIVWLTTLFLPLVWQVLIGVYR